MFNLPESSRFRLENAPDARAIMRYGLLPRGTVMPGVELQALEETSYVLDLDFQTQAQQPFDVDVILAQLSTLHSQIEAFFRWSLTPDGEMYLGLQEL